MPRYFLHVRDVEETVDREGLDLPGLAEARKETVVAAGEALAEYGGKFWHGPELRIWMTDETDRTVCALRISAEC